MYTVKQSGKEFNKEWLKVLFANADLVNEYYSQAGQDIFALVANNGKKNGTYVELGCNEPFIINNTYLLESTFNWKGVSVDFDKKFEFMWRVSKRTSNMSTQDATTLDWDSISSTLGTTQIDYLSLDLEPASITYKALQNIPLDKISFNCITYEHDAYRFGDEWKNKSRELLTSKGYKLICGNIGNYEDWYVNEKYVNVNNLSTLIKEYPGLDGELHLMPGKVVPSL